MLYLVTQTQMPILFSTKYAYVDALHSPVARERSKEVRYNWGNEDQLAYKDNSKVK